MLPTLIWKGYTQEHQPRVYLHSNPSMINYWQGHGCEAVILIAVKAFDDIDQQSEFVDSTRFCFAKRLAFAKAVLQGMDRAAKSVMGG